MNYWTLKGFIRNIQGYNGAKTLPISALPDKVKIGTRLYENIEEGKTPNGFNFIKYMNKRTGEGFVLKFVPPIFHSGRWVQLFTYITCEIY